MRAIGRRSARGRRVGQQAGVRPASIAAYGACGEVGSSDRCQCTAYDNADVTVYDAAAVSHHVAECGTGGNRAGQGNVLVGHAKVHTEPVRAP